MCCMCSPTDLAAQLNTRLQVVHSQKLGALLGTLLDELPMVECRPLIQIPPSAGLSPMSLKSVPTGKNPPEEVNVVIEIPQGGEPIKYEIAKDSGALFVD